MVVGPAENGAHALGQLRRALAAAGRDADDILPVRQDAEIGIALIEHADARRVRRAELVDEPVDDGGLRLPLGVREVDHVQEHIGIRQLLERGLERLDQVRRQLADEADRVREQHLLRGVDAPAAGRGVERVEQAVVGRDVRPRQAVEQRGFAGVRVADEGHDRQGVFLAAAALRAADLAHVLEFLLQLLDLAADVAAVGLELRFAGAARADRRRAARGCLPHKVRPHARQARQQVLVLRQLHLQLALARLGALGKDVEDQARAVEHAHAEFFLQHAHLRRGELVVKHREVAVVGENELAQLRHLALAEEGARVGRGLILQQRHDGLAAGRLHERGELGKGNVRRALARIHARCGETRQRGAFDLLFGRLHRGHPLK